MYNWRESAYHRTKATGLEATLPSASRQIRLPALHFGSTSVTTTIDRDLSPHLQPFLLSPSPPFHSERHASEPRLLLRLVFSHSSSLSLASVYPVRREGQSDLFCDLEEGAINGGSRSRLGLGRLFHLSLKCRSKHVNFTPTTQLCKSSRTARCPDAQTLRS